MDINQAITERIKNLCEEKGWTTNELIRRSGVNQSTFFKGELFLDLDD